MREPQPNISLSAPVHPGELDKRMYRGLNDLAGRVAAKAIREGRGQDILLRIYMAGLYHGMMLVQEQSHAAE